MKSYKITIIMTICSKVIQHGEVDVFQVWPYIWQIRINFCLVYGWHHPSEVTMLITATIVNWFHSKDVSGWYILQMLHFIYWDWIPIMYQHIKYWIAIYKVLDQLLRSPHYCLKTCESLGDVWHQLFFMNLSQDALNPPVS